VRSLCCCCGVCRGITKSLSVVLSEAKRGIWRVGKVEAKCCKDNFPSVSLDMGVNSAKDCWHLGKDACLGH
jgi:hypothetical protein